MGEDVEGGDDVYTVLYKQHNNITWLSNVVSIAYSTAHINSQLSESDMPPTVSLFRSLY